MIYLDNASTSMPFQEILEGFGVWSREYFANPNSVHPAGQKSRREIDRVRRFISSLVGSEVEEVVFLSGATEGNNTVIKGLGESYPEKKRILVSPVEHKSVLMPAREMVGRGFKVEFLKVDGDGVVDLGKKG